jgi:hypothetical protein
MKQRLTKHIEPSKMKQDLRALLDIQILDVYTEN